MHVPQIRTRSEFHRNKWYRHPTGKSLHCDIISDPIGDRHMSTTEVKLLDWIASERCLEVERYTVSAYSTGEELQDALQRCLSAVSGIVEGVEALSIDGTLRYLQDVTSCILSNATIFVKQASVSPLIISSS